ncbi:MAG: FtsQ-type POTRA domain-containing protein [Parcubacteria group bacterium]|nr:FtsQ-type POTRA domain-containing protein [Parcubacteria group bacterium]
MDSRKKKKQWKKNKIVLDKDRRQYKGSPFKKRRKEKKTSISLKIIFLILVVFAWLAILLCLPFFRITQINYTGLQNITKNEIDDYASKKILKNKKFIPYNNFFLIRPKNVTKDIKKDFPVKSVAVKKIFPNKLEIDLVEKISSLVYDNENKYFLMDNTGYLIKYLSDINEDEFILIKTNTSSAVSNQNSELLHEINTSTIKKHVPNYKKIHEKFGNYPILYDSRKLKAELNQGDFIPTAYIENIINFYTNLSEQGIADIKYLILENIGSGVKAITNVSWNLYFDPNKEFDSQINNLKIILKNNKPQEYVDVRYGSRVYWK